MSDDIRRLAIIIRLFLFSSRKQGGAALKIHFIQNYSLATPGYIGSWALQKGHQVSLTKPYDAPVFPKPNDFDLLIILGGTIGAYEEKQIPWLRVEKEFIQETMNADKCVLGICLGAQLIAQALGAKVFPHKHKEIGWWPIRLTQAGKENSLFKGVAENFTAFEFHQDTFDLPDGAVLLATSQCCANQAFMYGKRIFGVQFHPELTNDQIHCIMNLSEAGDGPYEQDPDAIKARSDCLPLQREILYTMLENIEAMNNSQSI